MNNKDPVSVLSVNSSIGIIQRSGFANGFFGAGARLFLDRCLEYHGLKISRVVGVSAQSFSVALQSIGLLEEIVQAWLDLTTKDIYHFDKWGLLLNPIKFLKKWPSILDSTPLRNYVAGKISGHEDEIFSDKAIPFDIITTNISANEDHCIFFDNSPDNKKIILDICMASATLVPWFRPLVLNYEGKKILLADGAFSNDMPIKRLTEFGCDTIFIVDYYGGAPGFEYNDKPPWHESTSRSLQVAVEEHSRLRTVAAERTNKEIQVLDMLELKFLDVVLPNLISSSEVINDARTMLGVKNKKETKLINIQNLTKPKHIGFTEFNNITKRNLILQGYYLTARKMQELGFDIEPVLNMSFRKKLEFSI